MSLTQADVLTDRVACEAPLLRALIDPRTVYCKAHQEHAYGCFLTIEDIDHPQEKTKSLQTNVIRERFPKTIFDELYRVASRKKLCIHVCK